MMLSADDLADSEVDFTVQGKVGSCGSCALGDAFREYCNPSCSALLTLPRM